MIVAALVLLAVGGAGFLYRLVRGPTLADRVVVARRDADHRRDGDPAWSAYTGDGTYLTVGVVVALVAFLGTSAFARFVEGRRR